MLYLGNNGKNLVLYLNKFLIIIFKQFNIKHFFKYKTNFLPLLPKYNIREFNLHNLI